MKRTYQRFKQKKAFTIVITFLLLAVGLFNLLTHLVASAQDTTPIVEFTQALYVIPENIDGGQLLLDVRVSGLVSGTVSVEYSFEEPDSNPAALFGDDYSSQSGGVTESLTFDPQNTSQQILVTINNDNVVEDTEEFQVALIDNENVELGDLSFAVVRIENDDCTVDNSSASTPQLLLIPAQTPGSCLTQDQFFVFTGKAGKQYQISTNSSGNSIDTHLYLYDDPAFTAILAQNDDANDTTFDSSLTYQAQADKNYYVRVENKQSAVANVTDLYTLSISLANATQPTATETPTSIPPTRVPFDAYEDNHSFDTAFVIAPDTTYDLNFVPVAGSGPDNDFFKIWVKEGWRYSCETLGLSPYNDTNMIIYDQNQTGLAGNDDKAPGELGSLVEYTAAYTGWLYVLIGPNVEVNYNVSDQYEYQLECLSFFGTPTPTPRPVSQSSNAPSAPAATAVPTTPPQITSVPEVRTPQAAVSQAEIDTQALEIVIQELPSDAPTPITLTTEDFVVVVTIANPDGQPQGISNIPIALYSQAGELLAFGYTNLQGSLSVKLESTASDISVVVPYFGIREQVQFSQTKSLNIQLPPVDLDS